MIEVHGSAARDEKNVLHPLSGDKANDIVGKFHVCGDQNFETAANSLLAPKGIQGGNAPRGEQRIHHFPDGAVAAG
ncbi:MAG: hypothetical protein WCA44_08000, partial [Acidobacteriaceae bacterium]